MRRAVITGVGVVSACGVGVERLWDGLAAGGSRVGPIRSFDASSFPTRVAAEVPVERPDAAWLAGELRAIHAPEGPLERWESAGVLRDRKVPFALLAAAEAWRSAGCGASERGAWLSISLGLERAFFEDFALLHDGQGFEWSREEGAGLPKVRFRAPFDLGARCVAALLGLEGPVAVHASACAGGALALSQGASLVERGAATRVLCGGADSMVNPMGLGGFSRLGAPSPRNEPDACRPFDRRRDGLAIGEGAAMFVVEDEAVARARGARPLARILGWGSTQDAYRATAPRPDGVAARAAIERALRRAGLPPEAIGYINAHGTGTPLNDPAEAAAIRGALGRHGERVPVSSIKGALGHLMAASGALELAACLLPFARDLLPGTANHRELDPDCPLDVIGERPRLASVEHVLKNSFGFGGQNASVLLGRIT